MFQKIKGNGLAVKFIIVIIDVLILVFSGGIALLARFDFSFNKIIPGIGALWLSYLPWQIVITIVVFAICKMYRYVWHNISVYDIARIMLSVVLAFGLNIVIQYFLTAGGNRFRRMPLSVLFIELVVQMILFTSERCLMRFISELSGRNKQSDKMPRIMLIGAGSAGHMFLQEAFANKRFNGKFCCIIDDNETKWNKVMDGIPIVGGREKIAETVIRENIDEIILAIPAASKQQQKSILDLCYRTGCKVKIVPGIEELIDGGVHLETVRDVQVEDLLGRDPIELDTVVVRNFIKDRVVLVTGGGGSIGSELCRQIAKYGPKRLIIIDIYENNAYDIQQELKQIYGDKLDLDVEIASVRDKEKIYSLFDQLRPEIVFHAAAHKHVPLMEHCPSEAIKNNVFGTYHVVRAAEKYGVHKFVMISTDKAVNPTNFMGATKRFTEMVMQSRTTSPTDTVFCAVRFGNVLGSNGSVVPLFKKQIAAGGPVTITDKRVIRYFMTIPEAAQLVLEAGAMAEQSQIFVLDMGEPVKILDLAENLIRLSGYEPYVDIDIKEIGLRPGEKLYEELLIASNNLVETPNKKIFIEQQTEIDPQIIMNNLEKLDAAVTDQAPNEELISLLKSMVPTYRDPSQVNRLVD